MLCCSGTAAETLAVRYLRILPHYCIRVLQY